MHFSLLPVPMMLSISSLIPVSPAVSMSADKNDKTFSCTSLKSKDKIRDSGERVSKSCTEKKEKGCRNVKIGKAPAHPPVASS
jgi:hypothetical protein